MADATGQQCIGKAATSSFGASRRVNARQAATTLVRMAKSDAVAGFLVGFAAACELRGYPSWVERQVLGRHVATAERILDGARPAADESRAMTEFAKSLREVILARSSRAAYAA